MANNKKSKNKAVSPYSGGEIPLPGPGRPKGSKNRFTCLRDAFLKAFSDLGGADGLVEWVKKSNRNRAEFYKMITKMLPSNVDISSETGITVIISDDLAPKVPKNGKNEDKK